MPKMVKAGFFNEKHVARIVVTNYVTNIACPLLSIFFTNFRTECLQTLVTGYSAKSQLNEIVVKEWKFSLSTFAQTFDWQVRPG